MRNMTQPVDQKNCNSCWAIATCQAMSDRLRLKGKISLDDELNYFTFHDYMISLTPELDNCALGAYLDTGVKMSVAHGAPLMSQTQDREFDDRYIISDIQAPTIKPRQWRKIQGRTVQETIQLVKNELERNGSLTTMINIFNSFNNYVGATPYIPHRSESADPGMVHMVSIVGYDDRDNTWIIRNSFGRNSGFHGYMKIRQGDPLLQAEEYMYAPDM